ncbi:hypothetical protein [Candidatus Chloroploca sp. Khr17]|uniref:hypothetical protein n=1 Tax=Candidatus Chloroploca sp. Khr17 TaxID=2496869 RepID=UPI00101D2010|nr:hypothetical protein [Candidatus Chloroploca sp. Khr17]
MDHSSNKQFRGYKAGALHTLFFQKYNPEDPQDRIDLNMEEIKQYLDRRGETPGNIHNFFKDIVRSGKMPSQLSELKQLGYHIIQTEKGGAFVRSTNDSVSDIVDISTQEVIYETLNSDLLPAIVWELIRTDEGAIMSILEYCKILERVTGAHQVFRVQAPLKVQPNEVDGCYVFEQNGLTTLIAVEAKSKGSDVLLKHQIFGSAHQALNHFGMFVDEVRPVGIKIQLDNTLLVVTFGAYSDGHRTPEVESVFLFTFSRIPYQWTIKRTRKGQLPLL